MAGSLESLPLVSVWASGHRLSDSRGQENRTRLSINQPGPRETAVRRPLETRVRTLAKFRNILVVGKER